MPEYVDAREHRLQLLARHRGFCLQKSLCRDPKIPSFGGYLLVELQCDRVVVGDSPFPYSADLDDVENYLNG